MPIDLHLHSNASDGTLSPSELITVFAERGYTTLSLVDHNNVGGLAEAEEAAARHSIRLIPGIEISTIHEGQEIHIIGYFIDYTNPEFLARVDYLLEQNLKRLSKMLDKLNELGYNITLKEVQETSVPGIASRPHLANVLVNRGFAATFQDAFYQLIGTHGPAGVELEGVTPRDAYEMIEQANGIGVIAHPGFSGRSTMLKESEIIFHRDWGAKGIEVYHPHHDSYMVNYYEKVAEKLRMLKTGGSDFHRISRYSFKFKKSVPDSIAEELFAYHSKMLKSDCPLQSRKSQ